MNPYAPKPSDTGWTPAKVWKSPPPRFLRTRWICGLIWCVCHAAAFAMDLWLVFNKHESISSRVWTATDEHPTLIAAGVLASVGIAWLVRYWAWMVFFTGIMCGHLFVHW